MKIIFANRKDCFDKPGGDTVQMMKTKEYLEKQFDIDIFVCTSPEDLEKFPEAKIVHIFNLQTINETNQYIKKAKSLNKKVVLSTIYWNLLDTYYVKYLRFIGLDPIEVPDHIKIFIIKIFNIAILLLPFLRKNFKNYIDKGLYGTTRFFSSRKEALINADVLLPNSDEEMVMCAKDFRIDIDIIKQKTKVIPNAIEWKIGSDIKELNNKYNEFDDSKIKLPENYVICAGRFNSDKNQINILRALSNEDITIVFAGGIYDKHYYNQLLKKKTKRCNVVFLPRIPQTKLFEIYKNAKCHILPSFYETTGLVSLEAIMCGCPIVVSTQKHCPVKYYQFEKYGYTCNPYSLKSIKKATYNAIKMKKNNNIDEQYKQFFSYDNVAKTTYQVYKEVLVI